MSENAWPPCCCGADHSNASELASLRASLSAAERERDRAVDLAKEYRDALARILPERDAAERRVGELEAAARAWMSALDDIDSADGVEEEIEAADRGTEAERALRAALREPTTRDTYTVGGADGITRTFDREPPTRCEACGILHDAGWCAAEPPTREEHEPGCYYLRSSDFDGDEAARCDCALRDPPRERERCAECGGPLAYQMTPDQNAAFMSERESQIRNRPGNCPECGGTKMVATDWVMCPECGGRGSK
jgi:DNA-directed RNA polymerase subunit RPC12/RpoP